MFVSRERKKFLAFDCNKTIEVQVCTILYVMICFFELDAFNESTYSEQMSLTQFKKLALGLVGIKYQKRVPAL